MEQSADPQYPTWRKFVIFIGCCVLYLGSYSSELTSGIPYSELLLAPCGKNESGEYTSTNQTSLRNTSGVYIPSYHSTSEAAVTSMTTFTTNSTKNTSNSGCGGFGQGASKTGNYKLLIITRA